MPERLDLPTGELMQRPPAYSAVKVGGERLYTKARRGEAVSAEPRPVTVFRFEQLWREEDRVGLEIECSSGTYIRQLVADFGDAYCEELERTAIGPFRLSDAHETHLVPLNTALSFLPEQGINEEQARRVSHGMPAPLEVAGPAIRLVHDDSLIAIAEPDDERLKPKIVFPQ